MELDIFAPIVPFEGFGEIKLYSTSLNRYSWLAGQSYEYQYEFGLDVLRQFGVIK